jgi:glycosyltransferase involved in cell wall biosynthesis
VRILMISTEYPPMKGGVGRYTKNLVTSLRNIGIDVYVGCNEKGAGDFLGLEPNNKHNSDVLLGIVDKLHPDIVHVQYEQGLYGLSLGVVNPTNTSTNIDYFYSKCQIPIVTTFHSAYTFRQWMKLIVPIRKKETDNKFHIYACMLFDYWKHLINYQSFNNLNKQKIAKSRAGIVFSHYLSKLIGGGCNVIYHGAASPLSYGITKAEARSRLSLLPYSGNKKVALALGFLTATKGWDILEKMDVPDEWVIVLNSSKNHYSKELTKLNIRNNKKIINMQKDYLSEEELSLLFCAADAVILPYKACSGSGVMFDALGHGLPFVASNLRFFKEFSTQNFGITVRKRDPNEFSRALDTLGRKYSTYKQAVDRFKKKLDWESVAQEHAKIYMKVMKKEITELIAQRDERNLSNLSSNNINH